MFDPYNESIWREVLLHKASDMGITGRFRLYIRNILWDRVYYIKVNDNESQTFKSAVGIPRGSVISQALCILYTHDSMEGVEGKHIEYADDVNLWSSDENLTEAGEITNRDLNTRVMPWCSKWKMSVAVDKTDVGIVTPDGQVPSNVIDIKLRDKN